MVLRTSNGETNRRYAPGPAPEMKREVGVVDFLLLKAFLKLLQDVKAAFLLLGKATFLVYILNSVKF